MVAGYLRRAILWHLMEEGVLGMDGLRARTGCNRQALVQATASLRALKLVAYIAAGPGVDGRTRTFGLTPAGIEAALPIKKSDFEGVKPKFINERK